MWGSPEGMNSMDMCNLTIHIRKPGRLPSFDGHAQFITTGPCIPFFIQIAFKFPSSNNPLSIITNYNWQVAALTRCHEPPCYLVLATPLLSSWWIATSLWSKETFVTSMGVPTSQIGMLSTLKVPSPNHNRLQLRLSSSAMTVRSFLRSWKHLEHWFIMIWFSVDHPGISRSFSRASNTWWGQNFR